MLATFHPSYAAAILAWASDDQERSHWAALEESPDVSIFSRWHADDDVAAYVLLDDGEPVAYGEVWTEPGEAEFARVLVDPSRRREGVGRRLLLELMDRSDAEEFWVRVFPDNIGAIALYESVGFRRASQQDETRFNAAQRREYVWLRHTRE